MVGDGARLCQATLTALGQIETELQKAHALRANLGPDLFTPNGGAWTGPDAVSYQSTLTSLLETEQRMLGQVRDMLDELHSVFVELQTLEV
jgi:hypothetical protein